MSLYDYYVETAKDIANSDDTVVNKQSLFNILSARMPAFDGIKANNLRASIFANESYKLNVDTTSMLSAFDDLYSSSYSDNDYMQQTIRSAYASTSVIITYYAAIKSFSNMAPYYTNVFVPTVKNVQSNNGIEMIGTVLLNSPDILSTVKDVSFSADCDLRTNDNSVYLFKYSYDAPSSMQTANLELNFTTNKISFVSFENFMLNSKVYAVTIDGNKLNASDYTVYYIGATVRIYFHSSYEASSIVITLVSFLQQHMQDNELYKLQVAQKSISDFSLDDMYRMSSSIYTLTGIKHLRNYLNSIGVNTLPTLSSFTFFDISNVIVGYAEFNNESSISYAFDNGIYGVRIFPEYPGILVNNQYSSRTFTQQLHTDTLDVNVSPSSQYVPGIVGYIFALYR